MASSNEEKDDVRDTGKSDSQEEESEAPNQMDWLKEYFATALGIDKKESLLEEVNFEGIAKYIQSDKCKKIVTMAGAGISTSAGIPDFRSPGSGFYDRLKSLHISNPQKVFELEYFKEHPDVVYSLSKQLMLGAYKPTPCHYFLKLLEKKGKLLRHFTQNIDGLELDAGVNPDLVVQAHGTCSTYSCMKCQRKYSKEYMTDLLKDDELKVPTCSLKECTGVIRPDIVFFGESLPARFAETMTDIGQCDMMIILGTSLVVQPFASLTSRCKSDIPRLYINMQKTYSKIDHPLAALMFGGGGFAFDDEDNIRDVFWQGKCDNGCYALAERLGWGNELVELVHTEHSKIDRKLGKPEQPPWEPSSEKSEDTDSQIPDNENQANQVTKENENPEPSNTSLNPVSKSKAD